jgi:hypothetical protein
MEFSSSSFLGCAPIDTKAATTSADLNMLSDASEAVPKAEAKTVNTPRPAATFVNSGEIKAFAEPAPMRKLTAGTLDERKKLRSVKGC